jgi:hypothetical protein
MDVFSENGRWYGCLFYTEEKRKRGIAKAISTPAPPPSGNQTGKYIAYVFMTFPHYPGVNNQVVSVLSSVHIFYIGTLAVVKFSLVYHVDFAHFSLPELYLWLCLISMIGDIHWMH